MVTLKRMDKRLNEVESWMKNFEKGTGPAQTMDNMNWLVGQARVLGDMIQEQEQQINQMSNALQSNNEILMKFLDNHDKVRDWQIFLEEIQKEAEENAVQEQETESLDAQEQAEDGDEVGEGNAEEA